MTAPVVNPRETRKPEFPATVHAYSDALILVGAADADGLTVDQIATATDRTRSNVRRDGHKLVDAGVIAMTDGEPGAERWTLTDKGARWVAAMAVASGDAVPAAVGTGDHAQVHPRTLRPDPDQPRKAFDPVALADLAVSIRDKGVLLPILVRPRAQDGTFMIIAGERRWRACMTMVDAGHWPDDRTVTIKVATPADEAEAFELAVIENMQRDQLNHMEMGHSFERMGTVGGKSNAEIARVVGKTPEFVQQHRRLTRLDADMQALVAEGRLSMHEALKLLAGPTRGGAAVAPQPAAEDETAALFPDAPTVAVEPGDAQPAPEPETPWTRGGFRMVRELKASGAAIPNVCSRAPVARLYMQGDAFSARYRVQVVVDFGGGHTIESSAIPGAQDGHIAVACATDDILARWPAGRSEPPRAFVEWLDKMTGKPHVVAGKFCEDARQADELRAKRGWGTTPPPSAPAAPAADEPALKPRHRLILIELAHKIADQRRPLDPMGGAEWSGDAAADYLAFGAFVGSYWLDQGFNELATLRMIRAAHQPAGQGILAALTPKAVEWFIAEGVPLPPSAFTVRDGQKAVADAGRFDTPERYSTAWLATEARSHADAATHVPTQPAPDGPDDDANDDPWDRSEDQIAADAALRDRAYEWTGAGLQADPDTAELLRDLGVHRAKVHPDGWLELLGPDDALLTAFSIDSQDRMPDERVHALEHLIGCLLNKMLESN